jgi:rsbT co-antagonist protein RsbR
MGRLTTLRNLKHGLREAFRFARREREWARDMELDRSELDEPEPRRRTSAS